MNIDDAILELMAGTDPDVVFDALDEGKWTNRSMKAAAGLAVAGAVGAAASYAYSKYKAYKEKKSDDKDVENIHFDPLQVKRTATMRKSMFSGELVKTDMGYPGGFSFEMFMQALAVNKDPNVRDYVIKHQLIIELLNVRKYIIKNNEMKHKIATAVPLDQFSYKGVMMSDGIKNIKRYLNEESDSNVLLIYLGYVPTLEPDGALVVVSYTQTPRAATEAGNDWAISIFKNIGSSPRLLTGQHLGPEQSVAGSLHMPVASSGMVVFKGVTEHDIILWLKLTFNGRLMTLMKAPPGFNKFQQVY